MKYGSGFFGTLVACTLLAGATAPAAEPIPHAQDKPPGPALSPAEAIARMTVPPGFSVELVASEPDIVNPVAMTFDERGRVWITESLEYPRQEAGPGRDRVKILEDTDGDGQADRFTIFAEGLNIPSGIAVGHGGVWVANAPDILFLKDTDGDGRADTREVVVTGFGRDDTHELPNSLTWGPDGWLYGLNGVFNASRVTHRGVTHEFTCALWRIHPRTRDFQLFAQGTSNPWGIAWDGDGSAFVSACVIDHLWHLTETGYYIRQGGPYPPFTKPMGSIVKHKHQKAAYCGIHFFDSDAYPAEFRERLYMGNIHGNAINVDTLARDGATYLGTAAPDFLNAHDAWFMPVVQKTGPDGCLYILDWYDRYHCYQDARRDPQGIDRLKGRLYRVRYQQTPRAPKFDLAAESDDQLIVRLHGPNVYFRDVAQRILSERGGPAARSRLAQLAADSGQPRKARLHALWALVGGGPLERGFHERLLADTDAGFRAWAVRAAGDQATIDPGLRARIAAMTGDPAPEVRLQVAIAARKLADVDPLGVLVDVLVKSADDRLIPHIVWQNLQPLLEERGEDFLQLAARDEYRSQKAIEALMPQVVDRVLASSRPAAIVAMIAHLDSQAAAHPDSMKRCLQTLAARLENHEIPPDQFAVMRPKIEGVVARILAASPNDPLYADASLLAATWRQPQALATARTIFASPDQPTERRVRALRALVAAKDDSLAAAVGQLLAAPSDKGEELTIATLESLAELDEPWVGSTVVANYPHLAPAARAAGVRLLTERRAWTDLLLDAIGQGAIPAQAINANQARNLLVNADSALAEKIKKHWGTFREGRDPKREEVVARMRSFLRRTPGDAVAGQAVFKRVCGQCHKLYGEGQDVGPDITVNGRSTFDQLLSNVFDPSLVIGASYQAQTVVTSDGRVLSGLLVEDSPQRVVLKTQGGNTETIASADVEQRKTSALSLMPEDLEKQLKPQELADLFALLTLDKPPQDASGKKLFGSDPPRPVETNRVSAFSAVVDQIAPRFVTLQTGGPGLAIVAEQAGRKFVLRTSPVNKDVPCMLRREVEIPQDHRARLELSVSHNPREAWTLMVQVNGKQVHESRIGGPEAEPAWKSISIDLGEFVGQTVQLMLLNAAAGDQLGAAYWGQADIIFD